MAKIENLSVSRIKVADNAITGAVSNSNTGATALSVSVTNALGFPIIVTSAMVCVWHLPNGSDGAAFRMITTRSRDSTVIIDRSQSVSGVSSSSTTLSAGALDGTATTSETYTTTVSINLTNASGAASASVGEKAIRGLYTKR